MLVLRRWLGVGGHSCSNFRVASTYTHIYVHTYVCTSRYIYAYIYIQNLQQDALEGRGTTNPAPQKKCYVETGGHDLLFDAARGVVNRAFASGPARSESAGDVQGLLFWLFQGGFQVSSEAVLGIEAVVVLTLIILK